MKSISFMLGILTLALSASAWATPAEVIIIRHGEKPAQGNALSAQGFERANALPFFFETNPYATANGLPVAIYAMGQKPNDPDDSIRAIETVSPLAQALGLDIYEQYTRQEIQPLTNEILNTADYEGHTVVICWEHTMIPGIAQLLGVNNPPQWDGNDFDSAWILNYSGDSLVNFNIINEDVLPSDLGMENLY